MMSATWILGGLAECAGQPGGVDGSNLLYLLWKEYDFRIKSGIPKFKLVGLARPALPTGGAAESASAHSAGP